MSTTVYMKMLEQNPAKYDRGMRILTLGRIDRIGVDLVDDGIGLSGRRDPLSQAARPTDLGA